MIKFTFIFIILYWLIIQPKGVKAVNRYITICATLFVLMFGLRNEAIFGDTYGYVFEFKQYGLVSLERVVEHHNVDYLFWVLNYYICRVLGGNYTIWLTIYAIVIMIPVTRLIRRYSTNPMYSWILIIFLGFMYFFMMGMRQTLAMAFVLSGFMILMDENEVKRRKLKFVLLVLSASLFHSSALICLVSLLYIKTPKLSRDYIVWYSIALVVFLLAGGLVLSQLFGVVRIFSETDRFSNYFTEMKGSTYTYFLQQFIIVVPSLYVLRGRFHERLFALLGNFSIIGLLTVALSPTIAEMFRVSFYFSWANIILFPIAISTMNRHKSVLPIVYLLFFVAYLIFITKSAWKDYYFWFEDTSHIIQTFYLDELAL